MGKTIAVWGNSGSGKSTFSCILARALAQNKRKVIIINADLETPMLPVWLPNQIISSDASVGHVLSSPEIDATLVAGKVAVVKSFPFIGLMGYVAGDNPLSYPEIKYDALLNLIGEASKLVDYVITDCNSYMINSFALTAIEAADVVIRILTPDLKGVNYLKSHQPLLADARFHYAEHMTFAGLARPFHAIDKTGNIIGGWAGLLPYGKEIDLCVTEGNIFNAIDYCNPRYMESINKVLGVVSVNDNERNI
ncbi:MAG: ParA family protein [Oscillospiraceae bacterium]|nr:ParA family protein [Oscillospiraceae bacterium]